MHIVAVLVIPGFLILCIGFMESDAQSLHITGTLVDDEDPGKTPPTPIKTNPIRYAIYKFECGEATETETRYRVQNERKYVYGARWKPYVFITPKLELVSYDAHFDRIAARLALTSVKGEFPIKETGVLDTTVKLQTENPLRRIFNTVRKTVTIEGNSILMLAIMKSAKGTFPKTIDFPSQPEKRGTPMRKNPAGAGYFLDYDFYIKTNGNFAFQLITGKDAENGAVSFDFGKWNVRNSLAEEVTCSILYA
ncbi:hypothetical protein DdX_20603 [Ditylenchus destructor]|uniref:Uncharacterized protein n=1 Tax=Ditylenchus destructor TaxID=166010 RepID=A0AAD4MG34_9BILA|nr:hypothetical protein DdX_20603 [Ditylenchus destructor]